jgi:hypothetical protein
MKLSELKPCAICKGKITPMWYVLRFSQAMINPKAGNQVLGMAQYFGGISALHLAEAMSPEPDCVMIFGDADKNLMTEVHICQECFLMKSVNMAMLMESARDREEEPAST